jgi:hypothetical protein
MSDLILIILAFVIPISLAQLVKNFLYAISGATLFLVFAIFSVDRFLAEPDAMSVNAMWPITLPITLFISLIWSLLVIWTIRKIKSGN